MRVSCLAFSPLVDLSGQFFRAGGLFSSSPGQSGDKRDDVSVYALQSGERPVSSGLGLVTGGVVLSKMSRLLNQEDALSGPCLRGDFCSPQVSSRSAGMLRKGDQRVTVLTDAKASRWLAADARAERAGARLNRAVVA